MPSSRFARIVLFLLVLSAMLSVSFDAGQPTAAIASSGPLLSVNAGVGQHPISPFIYGMNFADKALAQELRLPVRRWGGNTTTRYNWQNDMSNHASD